MADRFQPGDVIYYLSGDNHREIGVVINYTGDIDPATIDGEHPVWAMWESWDWTGDPSWMPVEECILLEGDEADRIRAAYTMHVLLEGSN
jgi:hypothetical protein